MVGFGGILSLAGYALGALGGALIFVEFFQTPSYLDYDTEFNEYSLDIAPKEVREHTWAGRTGALLVALAFAIEFVATLVG